MPIHDCGGSCSSSSDPFSRVRDQIQSQAICPVFRDQLIVGDQALVPLILTPRDVSLVMAEDQHLPVLPLAPDAMDNLLAALNQLNPAAGPAERVGPAVNGIGQQVMDSVVGFQTMCRPSGP